MSTTRSVALVTCTLQPQLYEEEARLPSLIAERGIAAEVVSWDDATVDWSRFDAVVIRSTWDYFERHAEFLGWLDRVAALAPVHNSPALMRWNSDKHYLGELAARGVRVVPTVFCEPGQPASLAAIAEAEGWSRVVLKPAISGGAYRTHLLEATTEDQARGQRLLDEMLPSSAALLQPFFPEIQSAGEHSFFFFDRTLSHAIVKRPISADYRVQTQFGGTATAIDPPPALVAQARAVLDALPEQPAYARIDGVCRGDDFYLMEAELIEPYLFLFAAPPAATTAYVDLVARLAHLRAV